MILPDNAFVFPKGREEEYIYYEHFKKLLSAVKILCILLENLKCVHFSGRTASEVSEVRHTPVSPEKTSTQKMEFLILSKNQNESTIFYTEQQAAAAMKYMLSRRIVFLVCILLCGYNSLKGLKVFKATIFVKK